MKVSCLKFTPPVVMLLFVLTAAYPLLSLSASFVDYQIDISQPNAELVLNFSSPPVFKVRESKQDQVLDFDRALDLPDLTPIRKSLSGWIQNISASYDALLVQLQPGVTLELIAKDNNLHFIFKGNTGDKAETPVKEKSSLALERVEALLMLESGNAEGAGIRIKELMESYPDSTQLILDLARVEEKMGDWREALALYERAEVLMPYSSIVKLAKERLLRNYGSKVGTDLIYSKVGTQNTQLIGKLQLRQLRSSGNVWSVDYELRNAKEDFGVRRVNGDISPFEGSRYGLAIGLETRLTACEQKLSLYSSAKNTGLGWACELTDNNGKSKIQIEWQKPWYETPEAIVGYGNKSLLALNYSNTFQNKLNLFTDLSLNRYALDEEDNAAESSRIQLYLRYWFLKNGDGFSLGYAFDWEDVFDHAQRVDSLGNVFQPMPLASRELQVIDMGWNSRLAEFYFMEARLGYEQDQKRDASAPFARLSFRYQPRSDLEASLNLQAGLSTYDGGDDEFSSIGGSVIWFF